MAHLKYEGEYLNGEKNGKGKYYMIDGIKDKLEFEGEFRNEKKWNGKGYDKNGKIIYQLIHGRGNKKEFNKYGEFEFEGEFINGERNGKGKEYDYNSKLKFKGEYLNGERNGKGKEYNYEGKLIYYGIFRNGKNWMEMDIMKMGILYIN